MEIAAIQHEHYCLVCGAWATDEHLAAKKHTNNVGYWNHKDLEGFFDAKVKEVIEEAIEVKKVKVEEAQAKAKAKAETDAPVAKSANPPLRPKVPSVQSAKRLCTEAPPSGKEAKRNKTTEGIKNELERFKNLANDCLDKAQRHDDMAKDCLAKGQHHTYMAKEARMEAQQHMTSMDDLCKAPEMEQELGRRGELERI